MHSTHRLLAYRIGFRVLLCGLLGLTLLLFTAWTVEFIELYLDTIAAELDEP